MILKAFVLLSTLISYGFSGCLDEVVQRDLSTEPLKLIHTFDNVGTSVLAHVPKILLTEKLGLEIEFVDNTMDKQSGGTYDQLNAIANRTADMTVSNWNRWAAESFLKESTVEFYGDVGSVFQMGWCIPKFLTDKYGDQMDYYRNLKKFVNEDPDLFGNSFYTISDATADPYIVSNLGFQLTLNISATIPEHVAKLKERYDKKELFVTYCVSPHEMMYSMDLVRVLLPTFVNDASFFQGLTEYPIMDFRSYVHPDFAEKSSSAAAFLHLFSLTSIELNKIVANAVTNGLSTEDASCEWIKANDHIWTAWMPTDMKQCTSDIWLTRVSDCLPDNTKAITAYCSFDPSTVADTKSIDCDGISYSSALGIIVIGAAIILLTSSIGFFFWIFSNRTRTIIKTSQPLFLMLFANCGTVAACFGYFVIGAPNALSCEVLMFHRIPFVVLMGCLLVRLWRVSRLFNNKKLVRIKVSNSVLLRFLSVFVIIELICIGAQWISSPPELTEYNEDIDGFGSITRMACVAEDDLAYYVSEGYMFILWIVSIYYATKTYNVDSEFAESSNLMMAVVGFVFTSILSMLIKAAMNVTHTKKAVNIVFFFISIIWGQCVILLPKILHKLKSRYSTNIQRRSCPHCNTSLEIKICPTENASIDEDAKDVCPNCQKPIFVYFERNMFGAVAQSHTEANSNSQPRGRSRFGSTNTRENGSTLMSSVGGSVNYSLPPSESEGIGSAFSLSKKEKTASASVKYRIS
eukprot:TRINITY_DN81960_c0_g4_i2.p1 TRINITY_DN81960_c0_g4~~TRINITY_DN81960_c0_g4_i2.p1  ORF type:complete len:746 (-),score=137.25 TRINITY_DN81960_c0_g4_i2:191-2428(-)